MSQNVSPETVNPAQPPSCDISVIARDLRLPPEKVQKAVELLDEGNTVSFITRFRKDQTGALNETQILTIKQQVAHHRALNERKTFVLKSIDSQSKLTDELKSAIAQASTSRVLEDLYRPFKPNKQTRAATARQQGLEPLAEDILGATSADIDIATRATEYIRVDKGLESVDQVIGGVNDLVIQRFGQNSELRSELRNVVWQTGKLTSSSTADQPSSAQTSEKNKKTDPAPATSAESQPESPATAQTQPQTTPESQPDSPASQSELPASEPELPASQSELPASQPDLPAESQGETLPQAATDILTDATTETQTESHEIAVDAATESDASKATLNSANDSHAIAAESPSDDASVTAIAPETSKAETDSTPPVAPKKKKKKKKKKSPDPFSDYHDFKQALKTAPHHRVLAMNRGERAGKLKIKIEADESQLVDAAIKALVPDDHPFADFLKKAAVETLHKVFLPSLEREIRRELTETAEQHAVEVFASNLRNLLLQPPIRNRRILAIDPGYKNGCAVAVLDKFGNLMDSGHIFVVGNQTRQDEGKTKLVAWINQHNVDLIAIGTGAACRQTEQIVSDLIAEKFAEHPIRYVMISESGASIYSTSEIAREELPEVAPSIRSAISIGRRLQDPLSELVKIDPANIGVGMYQHDVKAKHLAESLDEIIKVCVNQVGVNLNTASPSLLKYVSGLNSLTARHIVEYRQQHGGFKNRQQLKEVSGIGETTFVQCAGFLRIPDAENPFDNTAIHPESYTVAESILASVGSSPAELFPVTPAAAGQPAETSNADNQPTDIHSADCQPAPPVSGSDQPASPPTKPAAVDADACSQPTEIPAEPSVEGPAKLDADPESSPVPPVGSEPPKSSANAPETTQVQPADVTGSNEVSQSTDGPSTESAHSPAALRRKQIISEIFEKDLEQLAAQYQAGKLQVRDILMSLRKPDWDPRDRVKKPVFRRGIIKIDDLKPEMQLDGQVVNVVDFGVFVDIGLGESSLVHVSQLSHRYVRDPHQICSVGDVLKVWVSEVEPDRRRVKLTAIQPGSTKPKRPSRPRRKPSSPSGDQRSARDSQARSGSKSRQSSSAKSGRTKSGSSRTSRHQHRQSTPRRPSRPAPPITDEMLKGDEPMRSFSDLLQFVKQKPDDNKEKKSEN